MDHHIFDDLTRIMARLRDRRTLAKAFGVAAAAPALAGIALINADDAGSAKKNKDKKPRRYKKKRKFCLNGQQVISRRKKRIRRWQRQGATKGKCPTACPAGSITVNGVCTPCTVTCSGDAATCGTALQNALTAGGVIYACPGTYGGSFTTGSVNLYGAGNGSDPATSTILDGQAAGTVMVVAPSATVTLRSLRLTNGVAAAGTGGGGISAGVGSSLTVASCVIAGNAAPTKSGGGGIFVDGGALQVQDSTVSGNTGDNGGGIRLVTAENSSITNSTITNNTATVAAGGGLMLFEATVTVTGTAISANTAAVNGGGVYLDANGDVTFDSASSITGNTAASGGSIYNDTNGVATLNGVTISGNTPNACFNVPGC